MRTHPQLPSQPNHLFDRLSPRKETPLKLVDNPVAWQHHLPLQLPTWLTNFPIKEFERPLVREIELRRTSVGMGHQINKQLLGFGDVRGCEAIDHVLKPDISMVLQVLPDHPVNVFADNETLVTYPTDYTWN